MNTARNSQKSHRMLGSQGRCSIHWNRCFARFESSGLSRDSAVVPRTQFVVLRMYTSRMRCTPPLDVTQVSELLHGRAGEFAVDSLQLTVERCGALGTGLRDGETIVMLSKVKRLAGSGEMLRDAQHDNRLRRNDSKME